MSQTTPPLAPRFPPIPEAREFAWEPSPAAGFSVSETFTVAWRTLTADYWRLVLATLLCGIVYEGLSTLAGVVTQPMGTVVRQILSQCAGFFLGPLEVTIAFTFLRAIRGDRPGVLQFLKDLPGSYWGLIAVGAASWFISVLLFLPVIALGAYLGMSPVGSGAPGGATVITLISAIVIFTLLALPALLYLRARLLFAGLLYMDAPQGCLGVIDALRLSWKRTSGQAWALVWLQVLIGVIVAASVLLLVLPVIFVGAPLANAAIAAAYHLLCPNTYVGMCPNCGYDCRHSPPGECPECGAPLPV